MQSSDLFTCAPGYPSSPLDDLITVRLVVRESVPDLSLNAFANLGYAEGRFRRPVDPGETLSTVSEVIGLRETSDRRTGVVHVRSVGSDAQGSAVLSFCRWLPVRERDAEAAIGEQHVPDLAVVNDPAEIAAALPDSSLGAYGFERAGSPQRFADYVVGERIDHGDGTNVEEAQQQTATRLVYGGHVVSLTRG